MRVEKPRGVGANIFNAFLINFLPRQWAKWAVGAWLLAKDKVATLVHRQNFLNYSDFPLTA